MNKHVEELLALSVKSGVSLHNLSHDHFRCVLAAAVLRVPTDRNCSEREINELLERWLATAGAMLRIDHVSLRRALVDAGLLVRDGFGRAYSRPPAPASFAPCVDALAAVEIDELIDVARRERAEARRVRAMAHGDGTALEGDLEVPRMN